MRVKHNSKTTVPVDREKIVAKVKEIDDAKKVLRTLKAELAELVKHENESSIDNKKAYNRVYGRLIFNVRRRFDETTKKRQYKYTANRQKRRNDRSRESAVKHCKRWTDREERFIIDNIEILTFADIASTLGRTHEAIATRVHLLRVRGKVK